ncbi:MULTISPECIES: thiol reductant ABC exporter subunit CydC [Marinobacter]|uniref:Thiol reductant ABC exporter subunit CydC n=1 Tax=Marinobacter xiaoshiensis TaxID=3073652 RepID=A0ABU2HHP3_9GAMM|nr:MULTISPECIES: thiol reductant ABC exporter subunit CydC [unclassified Marinobacter]MBK1886086.1 thiol reductant ABC exporter subunit CydC [Marinobacter sp. DY40_1A1]MDS1310542.1 thiol reductant ABC exporter subunit CydC [Marinobacter sp. F60267]
MSELKPWLTLIYQRPGRLFVGALLMLAALLSGLGLLALSGWFITETALVGVLLAASLPATINLYVPGGGIRFFAVSRTVSRYVERLYNHDTVLLLLTDIRVALFRKLAATGRGQRRELTGAQWLSRLTSDVDALDTLYLRLIAPTALAAFVALLLFGLAWILFDVRIAAGVALILGFAFVVATIGVYARTARIAARQSDQQESLRMAVVEHLEGFAELTAAGRVGKHGAWLMRQAHQTATEQVKADSRTGWHLAGSNLLINLSAAFALWAGFELFRAGAISGPVLVLLPIALLGLAEVYSMLPEAFGKLGATQASAARLNRDCRSKDFEDVREAIELPSGAALLAKDLTVKYPEHAPLFTHFDLQVATGERVGILGHSGSGKSSLADTFSGLLTPSSGASSSLPCAYLTQKTVLFEDTLRANLLLGAPDTSDAQLWRVLEMVDLAERFGSERDQLDTWLGSSGSRLSGGEARRVVLARVLLSPAPLLILDEPFTGVDAPTREKITKQMDVWLEGRTVISLAHGSEALPGTDRVIHLGV